MSMIDLSRRESRPFGTASHSTLRPPYPRKPLRWRALPADLTALQFRHGQRAPPVLTDPTDPRWPRLLSPLRSRDPLAACRRRRLRPNAVEGPLRPAQRAAAAAARGDAEVLRPMSELARRNQRALAARVGHRPFNRGTVNLHAILSDSHQGIAGPAGAAGHLSLNRRARHHRPRRRRQAEERVLVDPSRAPTRAGDERRPRGAGRRAGGRRRALGVHCDWRTASDRAPPPADPAALVDVRRVARRQRAEPAEARAGSSRRTGSSVERRRRRERRPKPARSSCCQRAASTKQTRRRASATRFNRTGYCLVSIRTSSISS